MLRPAIRHAALLALALAASDAMAWGDEGHEIVAQIASHRLTPAARQKVYAMLAADADPLTAHDLLSEATWADRFRDSDRSGSQVRFLATRQWHFTDIEVAAPDIDAACFGHPMIPTGEAASIGFAADCSVDKIDEFAAELANPATAPAERLIALKFLLHLVGDIHQPLHSSDQMDAGGNAKLVSAAGLGSGKLHGFWDTQFVGLLGTDPVAVGDALDAKITPSQASMWSQGTASDWALEAFGEAKATAYGKLPKPGPSGSYALGKGYVSAAKRVVASQLSRAGARLATILNRALD